jgi:hypothetical protein
MGTERQVPIARKLPAGLPLIDVPKDTEIVGYLASLPGRGRITSVRLGFFRRKWRPRGGRQFGEAAWQVPSN